MIVFAVLAAVAGAAQPQPPRAPPPPPPPAASGDTEVSGVVVTPSRQAPEPEWARKLNLDPRGDFARSDIPYLRRRPTNGCKLMAGGSASPAGVEGVAAGAVCVKRFTSPFR